MKIKAACQCNPVVIDGELTASEASNKNDETERQMTRVRTCGHIQVILDGKDGDVEGGDVTLADHGEVETSDEVTSIHGGEGVNEKGCSRREQDGHGLYQMGSRYTWGV